MIKYIHYLFYALFIAILLIPGCYLDQQDHSTGTSEEITGETLKNIAIPVSGLVARWEMSLINDRVPGAPSEVDGQAIGVTMTYGWEGKSLYFDGDDAVEVPDQSILDFGTSDFSFVCFIKPTAVDGIKTIIDKRDSTLKGYHITIYGGKLLLQLGNGPSDYDNYISTSTEKTIKPNMWHSILITVDRDSTTGINMYIDGRRVGTFDPTAHKASIANAAKLIIGHHKGSSSSNFKGRIDKIMLYNRALTSTDIVHLTTPGIPQYEPSIWNDNRDDNNCYNYAANVLNNEYAQPGYGSGVDLSFLSDHSLTASQQISKLKQAVLKDGLEPIDNNWWSMSPTKGVIALVFGYNIFWDPIRQTRFSDFHFYRMNNDLVTWSHKMGTSTVQYRDESGNIIYDPGDTSTDRGPYTYFVGYYKLWSDSAQGKGHEYIRGPY